MSSNFLSDVVIIALADALLQNKVVNRLDLSHNGLTEVISI